MWLPRFAISPLCCALVVGLFLSSGAFAQTAVPTKVNFTARLVDNGAPVNGNRDFVLKLFPTLVGASEVWFETRYAIPVVDGMVDLVLGTSTALTDAIFDGQTLFLEVTVNGTTLSPRTPVASVPYALRSTVAGRIGNLTEPDLQKRVSNECGPGTAIRSIYADGTVSCQASAVTFNDAGMSGLTSVTGTAGISGGGAVGDVRLSVDFAGSGSANTAARSDHQHSGTYLPKGSVLTCPTGYNVTGIEPTSGSVVCAPVDTLGGTVTSVVAGSGLTGGTITSTGTIALASTVPNWTSGTPSCPYRILSISNTGATTCGAAPPVGVSTVAAVPGGGMAIGGTATAPTLGLQMTGCSSGQVMKWNGSSWGCASDDTGTVPAASSTVAGIVQLANDADARDFSNASKAITPASMAAAFGGPNQSFGPAGFQKFPGGLIAQWGESEILGDVSGANNYSIALPIPFPNAVMQVMPYKILLNGQGGHTLSLQWNQPASTNSTIVVWGAETVLVAQQPWRIGFMAIGY